MASMSAIDFPGFDRLYDWTSGLEPALMTAKLVHPDGCTVMYDDPIFHSTTATLLWRPSSGPSPSNVLWTSNAAVVLVAQRIANMLTTAGITGWTSQPTACTERTFSHQYIGVRVAGHCGPLDFSRGTWVQEEFEPGRWHRVLRGLYFDEPSWDGSDVFSPEGMNRHIVNERTQAILRLARVENSRFQRLTEILTSETVIEALGRP